MLAVLERREAMVSEAAGLPPCSSSVQTRACSKTFH